MTSTTLIRLLTRWECDNRAPEEVARWKEAEVEALRAEVKKLKEEATR